MSDSPRLEVGFKDFGTGERFWMQWSPADGAVRGVLLHIPPFGEEMNKSRRTTALAARRMAGAGYVVRFLDAFGTGDSPGEFGEATWDVWIEDFRAAARDLALTTGYPVIPWGHRAGCLIVPDLVGVGGRALLWQPVTSGDQHLTQILRLKVAADTFAGHAAPPTTKSLRGRLEAGEVLEIAGYLLNPALVLPLARRTISAWASLPAVIDWIETGTDPAPEPPPGSARAIASLRSQGIGVAYAHVVGEPYWMTLEIAENRAMGERSLDLLGQGAMP